MPAGRRRAARLHILGRRCLLTAQGLGATPRSAKVGAAMGSIGA